MASERRRRTSDTQYIYNLPYFERKELCRILDVNNKWELLAGMYMHYTTLDIGELRKQERIGNSPTDQLLQCWGSQNHTILELFILLYKIKHYQAMMILKPFVDSQYHCLLFEGEESITRLLQSKLNTAGTSTMDGQAGGPSPSAPSPSSVQDKTLGYSKKNINIAGPADATPGPSYKAGLSELLHPQIKIQNTTNSESNEMNIHEGSPDGNQLLTFEHKSGPSVTGQPQISTSRRNSSPTSNIASPTLSVPAPAFPGSPSPKPENDKSNLSPNLSRNPSPSPSDPSNAEGRGISPTPQRKISCESNYSPGEDDLPHISYKELDIATGGWDKNNILGRGGFGTVFRGTWKNTQVAVKRLELQKGESPESQEVQRQQSLREMRILRANPHDNILPLYGYSMGGDQPCLVYKYMASGSLEDRLLCRGNTPLLSWIQRLVIATGTARGLQFLHNRDKPLIHGDIKSANILLDSALEPRIGDFGLAREGPQSQYTHVKVSRVHGTRPYLPDEFLRSKKLSTKVDTYSFGVVLFELATGLRAFDDSRPHKYLKDLVERATDDPQGGQIKQLPDKRFPVNEELFLALLEIGKICVKRNPKDRPEMVEVLADLCNRMKAFEMKSRAHGMQQNYSLQPSNPYSHQLFYDEQNRRRSSVGANFPASHLGSGSPVLGANGTPMYYPTGACPVANLLGSGFPIYSGHAYPSVHQGGLTPVMAINRGSHATLSQDTPPTPPVQNLYHSPPQNVFQRVDGIPPNYADFRQPAIAVMPPTQSKNLPSPAPSYCETDASEYSHATSFAAPACEIETDSNTDNPNAGNIPLLSVLGFNKDSERIIEEPSEQSEVITTNNSSRESLSNNIDKGVSQTSNNNVSTSNAITVRSCRSVAENPVQNPNSGSAESVLPNLQSLTVSPQTP